MTMDIVTDCINVLEQGRGLPGAYFNSDAAFLAEREHLFAKSWFCAALSHEVAAPGDVLPRTVLGLPLLFVRQKDGMLAAFHNSCRHRGALLTTEVRHGQNRLVCPYHAWMYGLDGTLKKTPHIGGAGQHTCAQVDTAGKNLHPVRCVQWGPFVLVNLSGDAAPFEDFIAPVVQRLGFVDWDALRCDPATIAEVDVRADWKVAVENYAESYHVPPVHPELEAVNPMADHYQILGGAAYVGQGGYAGTLRRDGLELPVFKGREDDRASYEGLYIYPNIIVTCMADMVAALIPTPVAPGQVRERIVAFFVGDAAMEDRYQPIREIMIRDWTIRVNDQDIGIIENVQQGRSSPAFDGGLFAPMQEATSLHFQKILALNFLKSLSPDHPAIKGARLPVENIHHAASRRDP